jgi:pyrroline-5-carboxylate reductase
MGRTMVLHEKDIAAFASIAGSGPAYVYIFIEALADAACKHGIARALAYEMAAQTCVGAGEMVLQTKMHPGELKDAVCSPGGTTIEAVQALEEGGFRATVIDAVDRCTDKFNRLA